MPGPGATSYPEVTGWIRAAEADFKLVKAMGLKETGILTSASDYHIFLKLKKTRSQALDSYLDIVSEPSTPGSCPAATSRTSRGPISTASSSRSRRS